MRHFQAHEKVKTKRNQQKKMGKKQKIRKLFG